MKNERSLLMNILAIAFLAVLMYFVYNVANSNGTGIKLLDSNKVENRVANRYLNKNVLDKNSKYEWGGQAEDSAANIVTSVVADYRLFDTSLEVIVLFVTIMGFGLVLPKESRRMKQPSKILYYWAPILMVFMLLVGGYMFLNGHLSPGGGFPAGAILSTAILLGVLAGKKTVSKHTLKVTEAIAGTSIFALAIAGYFIKGTFYANFLEGGRVGDLFSAGLIPILYTLVAFKVAAELSGIYFEFYEEGKEYDNA
ncbi:putative monovalent cation/H+ antiporter subunit B [Clostridium tepidiprofundi DSM 19306]|uniref:Putative monovalent cation/H+ antiporter subunit B n=1 Tax=Clostridium tepidiprofundi DSM 19306 TaxID=1121338 RepID=A0A151B688_9CLOT|nr:MnhB domain-containing protein [Clostridium tepidiprofundi]KYH35290.1 putative monovalent cation/H+ antiporter subunit B [Clostridium tepidiprofundi DSM 19306]